MYLTRCLMLGGATCWGPLGWGALLQCACCRCVAATCFFFTFWLVDSSSAALGVYVKASTVGVNRVLQVQHRLV